MAEKNMNTRFLPLTILILLVVLVVLVGLSVQTKPRAVVAQRVLPLTGDSISVLERINNSYSGVRHIFEQSCFDCHSAYTEFPWYQSLPLAGGLLEDHVRHGRKHLDLTNDFPFKGFDNQIHALQEIRQEIEEGEMPLWSYRLLHWGTAIEGPRRDSVFLWIDSSIALLKAADSTPPEN